MNALKLLLVLCNCGRTDDIQAVIDRHGYGFTAIDEARGGGVTGRHLGTRAFPGSSSLLLSAVPEKRSAELVEELRELSKRCGEGEGIKVFVLDALEAL